MAAVCAAVVLVDGGEFSLLVSRLTALINTPEEQAEQHMQKCVFIWLSQTHSLRLSISLSQTIEFVEYHFHDKTIDPGGCLHSLWVCR